MNEQPLNTRILRRLFAHHLGHEQGVSCSRLAQAVGASERDVRAAITELRLEEEPIGAHPRWGYFIIATPAEKKATCDFLRSRAMTSLKLEARLRRVPLGELVGQLNLQLLEDAP
jgi:biotin operon repressor